MGMFTALNISATALSVERQRSEIVAANLANVDTTHTEKGTGPYRRREVVVESDGANPFARLLQGSGGTSVGSRQPGGVRLARVVDDPAEPIRRYEPGHPDADAQGYISSPAINPAQEMVDLMGSVRSYQLNASAVQASKQIIEQSIDLLKS
jgi:flagellar basal-body rod protein FlgC